MNVRSNTLVPRLRRGATMHGFAVGLACLALLLGTAVLVATGPPPAWTVVLLVGTCLGACSLLFVAARPVSRSRAEEFSLDAPDRARHPAPFPDTRYERYLESAPNPVLIANRDGTIVAVNAHCETLFAYPREELIGQPVEILVPERYRQEHVGQRGDFFRNPTTRAMGAGRDLHGVRSDGREVPIEIGLNPLQRAPDDARSGGLVMASIIDISERLEAAQRIVESLREKELLLKEIHHRVKNNLAVIGSIFYLQSTTTQDADALRVLQECQDRVRSMALVHERLYHSDDLNNVDLGEYAAELARELVQQYRSGSETVRLELDLAPVPVALDRAIPCGLILTELITNALKHAFPTGRAGRLRVVLQAPDGQLRLGVADDGVGLPPHPERERETTMGLRLVESLAKQLDARIEYLRRDPGTEVLLTLEPTDVP